MEEKEILDLLKNQAVIQKQMMEAIVAMQKNMVGLGNLLVKLTSGEES